MDNNNYIVKSLELHLFFGRIMKEHSLFLRAGFTPANANFSNKAEYFKKEFEKLFEKFERIEEEKHRKAGCNSGYSGSC